MLSTNRHQIDNEFLLGVLFGIMEKCVDKSSYKYIIKDDG